MLPGVSRCIKWPIMWFFNDLRWKIHRVEEQWTGRLHKTSRDIITKIWTESICCSGNEPRHFLSSSFHTVRESEAPGSQCKRSRMDVSCWAKTDAEMLAKTLFAKLSSGGKGRSICNLHTGLLGNLALKFWVLFNNLWPTHFYRWKRDRTLEYESKNIMSRVSSSSSERLLVGSKNKQLC